MIKKILLLASVVFLITGCGNLELKKSASNKLFDTKGFDGAKRKPLYNGKYIDRAKRNVRENNYEEDSDDRDEADEFVDPYTQNRIMYSDMVRNEKSDQKSGKRRNNMREEPYPNIGHARDIAKAENKDDNNADLRRELSEIRTILASTKKDLAKYKCPLQDAKEPLDNNAPIYKKPIKKPTPVKHEIKEDVEEVYDEEDILPTATHNDAHENTPEVSKSHEVGSNISPSQDISQGHHTSEHAPVANDNKVTSVTPALAPAPAPVAPAPAPTPAPAPVAPTPVAKPVVQEPVEHKIMNLAPGK